jgi:hypothetical protein
VRLGGVLDELEAVAIGDRAQRRHVRRLAVEVDRDDRPGARADRVLDELRGDVPGHRVDIDRDGRRPRLRDAEPGGDERVARDDDLVAGADPEAAQQQVQRVEAAADADAVRDAAQRRELVLEGVDLVAEDEATGAHDAVPGRVELVAKLVVGGREVEEGNHGPAR